MRSSPPVGDATIRVPMHASVAAWLAAPSGQGARAGAALALVLGVIGCVRLAAGASFLGDDLVVLWQFQQWHERGTLLANVAAKLHESIDGLNAFFRPLPFATLALNFLLSGTDAADWAAVNLLLHVGAAALAGGIVYELAGTRRRAAMLGSTTAAATFFFLATGWEVALWITCRYDVIATFFTLAAGYAYLRRRDVLAFACAALALTAKESGALAIPLLIALATLRVLRASPGASLSSLAPRALQRAWPYFALGIAYTLLRIALFGSATRVYMGSAPPDLTSPAHWQALLASLGPWAHANFPGPVPLWVAPTLGLFVAGTGMRFAQRRSPDALAACVAMALLTCLAIVLLMPHVITFVSAGLGGRHLYPMQGFGAILLGLVVHEAGLAMSARPRTALSVLAAALVLMVLNAGWGVVAIEQFRAVHAQMRKVVSAVAARASSAARGTGYEVLYVPDVLGRIGFGRNAQAGLVLPPVQREALSDRVLVQTDAEFALVPQYIRDGVFAKLAVLPLASVIEGRARRDGWEHLRPARYLCWQPQRETFIVMEVDGGAPEAELPARLAAAYAAAGCGAPLGVT